jgi:CBS-domain-containing membrane protein
MTAGVRSARQRAGPAARVAFTAAAGVVVAGAVDHGTLFPLLFTPLGPTAYQLASRPADETSRAATAATAHAIGAGAGLLALWAFGLWTAPNVVVAGHPTLMRVGACGLALGLTLLILELLQRHHAPAGATALVVALGIAAPWRHLFGLLGGLAIVIALTWAISVLLRSLRQRRRRAK